MTWQADYSFYREVFRGTMEEAAFLEAAARAEDVLRGYERAYRVTGSPEDRARAVCAMAEVIAYFDAAKKTAVFLTTGTFLVTIRALDGSNVTTQLYIRAV